MKIQMSRFQMSVVLMAVGFVGPTLAKGLECKADTCAWGCELRVHDEEEITGADGNPIKQDRLLSLQQTVRTAPGEPRLIEFKEEGIRASGRVDLDQDRAYLLIKVKSRGETKTMAKQFRLEPVQMGLMDVAEVELSYEPSAPQEVKGHPSKADSRLRPTYKLVCAATEELAYRDDD